MLLKNIHSYNEIYIACGATDLRKAVDGLANIVRQDFQMDPFGNYLFLFCNRARNRLKGLTWDKNGFCLYYKRLDGDGAKFNWPNDTEAVRDIKIPQLRLLLDGFSVDPGCMAEQRFARNATRPPKGFGTVSARDF